MRARSTALAMIAIAPMVLIAPRAHADDLLGTYVIARHADPVLSSADATRRSVVEDAQQAKAQLLPQVSAGFDIGDTHVSGPGSVDDGTASYRQRTISANLSQVLVDLGRFARYDAASRRADAEAERYRASEQDLLIRVATAYFDVLLAIDVLQTVQADEDAFRQQVDQADQRYRNGLAAQVDVEQARAYYQSARTQTIGAAKSVDDARDALESITGIAPGPLAMLREELPMNPPSPDDPAAWVDVALSTNPTLRAGQRTVDAADRSIDAARAGHLPTLSAGVTTGRGASWPAPQNTVDNHTVTTIGLTLSVPLFAGGAIQSQVRQAVAQRDGAGYDLEAQRRGVARDTRERYRSVLAGIDQLRTSRDSVDSARRALDSTRVGNGLGTQTMTDLLLAIRTLSQAQIDYAQARHQTVLGRLLLLQSAGTIAEADLVAVNALLH